MPIEGEDGIDLLLPRHDEGDCIDKAEIRSPVGDQVVEATLVEDGVNPHDLQERSKTLSEPLDRIQADPPAE